MALQDLLQIIRLRWLTMVVPAAVVLLITLVTADEAVVPGPVYNVGVRFLVAPPAIDPASDPDIVPGEENRYYQWLTSEYVVNGMADWVNSIDFAERVAARVADRGGPAVDPLALFSGTSGEAIRSRLTLTMNAGDRAVLEASIQAAIGVILEESGEVIPHQSGKTAVVTLLDRPVINEIAPPITGQLDLPIRIVIALAAGVLIGLLVHYVDPYIRDPEEVETLVKIIGKSSVSAAAVRDVRAAVQLSGRRVVIVTAPRTTAGCAPLAANLAASLAQVGRATLLVDAAGGVDERPAKPAGPEVVNLPADEPAVPQSTEVDRLRYLPLASGGEHPADRLLGLEWEALLMEAEAVVIHALPILDDPTTLWLADHLQAGVVLGVQKGHTRRAELAAAAGRLREEGIDLLGAVYLN